MFSEQKGEERPVRHTSRIGFETVLAKTRDHDAHEEEIQVRSLDWHRRDRAAGGPTGAVRHTRRLLTSIGLGKHVA